MPKGVYERHKGGDAHAAGLDVPRITEEPDAVTGEGASVITPKSFLSSFLSGGPIIRHNVYRESENAGLNWEEVRKAFTELKGYEYFQKGEFFWRIAPE